LASTACEMAHEHPSDSEDDQSEKVCVGGCSFLSLELGSMEFAETSPGVNDAFGGTEQAETLHKKKHWSENLSESEWSHRVKEREADVAKGKMLPSYTCHVKPVLLELRGEGIPATPDPHDRTISKNIWRHLVKQWKKKLASLAQYDPASKKDPKLKAKNTPIELQPIEKRERLEGAAGYKLVGMPKPCPSCRKWQYWGARGEPCRHCGTVGSGEERRKQTVKNKASDRKRGQKNQSSPSAGEWDGQRWDGRQWQGQSWDRMEWQDSNRGWKGQEDANCNSRDWKGTSGDGWHWHVGYSSYKDHSAEKAKQTLHDNWSVGKNLNAGRWPETERAIEVAQLAESYEHSVKQFLHEHEGGYQ